jgi:hypothetical protein
MKTTEWSLMMAFFLFLPSCSFGVAVHDGVSATAALNVRSSPTTTATILATVPSGTVGLVIGGSISADGFVWWQIEWGSPFVTGWSVQDFLAVIPPSSTVYSDSLGGGWYDQQWSNTTVNYASTVARAGSEGIEVTASAPYARLYMKTNGFDTTGQQSLHISILNQNGPSQALYLGLYNTNGIVINYLRAWDYTGAGNVYPGVWYDLVIPVADLQAANQTIGGVVIEAEQAENFYVDEVRFSTAAGSTYWTPPTVNSVTVSCSPTSVQINGTSQCTRTVTGTGNPDTSVTWSVNGIQNGNSTVGMINSSLSSPFYSAPGVVPNPMTVTVSATSVLDTSKFGSTTITITGPTVNQTADTVFSDFLGAGWFVGAWNQVTVDAMSDLAYKGDYGMQVQVGTPNWGRVQLKAQPNFKFKTSGYNYLSFAVNIGQYEDETLYVGLLNSSGTVVHYVTLANYTTSGTLDAYQWQAVNIPLSDLGALNSDVYGVEIQSAQPATFSIDEVRFAGSCQ